MSKEDVIEVEGVVTDALPNATPRPSSRFPTVPVTQQILHTPNPLVIAQCRQSASIHTLCNYLIINTKHPVSVE